MPSAPEVIRATTMSRFVKSRLNSLRASVMSADCASGRTYESLSAGCPTRKYVTSADARNAVRTNNTTPVLQQTRRALFVFIRFPTGSRGDSSRLRQLGIRGFRLWTFQLGFEAVEAGAGCGKRG